MSSAGAVLLEARPFRPFKSSEEYLYAMKEDLAEWLTILYPELRINADNFLDRLDTGVALCRHANAVRESARLILDSPAPESEDAMTLAKALRSRAPVNMLPAAKAGTFFARDNLSNFIDWCRKALGILECLLFETDDLCLRKNEKHVVLCLLEVARKGAVLGMPAPLLVQMEKQIERELAGEELRPDDSALGLVPLGPQPQLVTNDLRSLDERVRDLVERCSCPTQFPMVRVSEGKYRIGDTRILIFVRILRSHVMVRVGGGWDTLAHYLDKHDPCRCRAQHRTSLSARLARPRQDLAGATVTYERPDPGPTSLPYTKTDKNYEPMSLQYSSKLYTEESRPQYVSRLNDAPASLPYMTDFERSHSPGRKHLVPRASSPGRKSSSPDRRTKIVVTNHLVPTPLGVRNKSPRPVSPAPATESASDNGSEVSDEGYRSLGVVAGSTQGSPSTKTTNRYSMHSQNSMEDAEFSERLDQDDGCHLDRNERVDDYVSLSTGLRKTDFSGTFYGKKPGSIDGKSNRGSPERIVITENNNSPSMSLRTSRTPLPESMSPTKTIKTRQASRIPHSPVRARTPSRGNTPSPKHAPNNNVQTSPKLMPKLPPTSRNTWSGRTAPNQTKTKARPTIGAETFENPNKSPKTKVKATIQSEAFKRNSPLRASSATLRSPPSQKPLSPLLEHILRSTETAKDDATVLEKMKEIIRTYSRGDNDSLSRASSKDSDYADFTSAWVMSDGKLERSMSTRQLAAPRKDPRNGASRIPAPVSIGCRRSTSTSQFQ